MRDFGNGDVPVNPFFGVRLNPRRSGWVEAIVLCRPCRVCLRLRSPRVHASVRGRRGGHQHDAGSMQFRYAHLTGVLRGASKSPDHGIIGTASLGTSKACRQSGVSWGPCVSGHFRCGTIGTEFRALDPHAMQNDTDAARQRDHRALRSPAAGNLCGPCPKPSRTATVHHAPWRLGKDCAKG